MKNVPEKKRDTIFSSSFYFLQTKARTILVKRSLLFFFQTSWVYIFLSFFFLSSIPLSFQKGIPELSTCSIFSGIISPFVFFLQRCSPEYGKSSWYSSAFSLSTKKKKLVPIKKPFCSVILFFLSFFSRYPSHLYFFLSRLFFFQEVDNIAEEGGEKSVQSRLSWMFSDDSDHLKNTNPISPFIVFFLWTHASASFYSPGLSRKRDLLSRKKIYYWGKEKKGRKINK